MIAVVASACTSASEAPEVSLPPPTSATTTSTSATTTVPTPPDDRVVRVAVGDDLAALVEMAPEGTTFHIAAGIHRGHSIEPKDGMVFTGEPGAVLSGAEVLNTFVVDGNLWRVDGVEWTARNHGRCVDDYEGCELTHDLFMDDVMLWQVTERAKVVPGTWFWENNSLWVADDPAQRLVEFSRRSYAFISAADDVTIRSLTVEKYATPSQEGAIQAQLQAEGERGARWLIQNVEVSGNHGAGIRTGDATVIRNVYVHHNGQMGITVSGGTEVLVEGSILHANNTAGFAWEWEAGGLKATNCTDVVMRANQVTENIGPGLWADLDCIDVTYVGNAVSDNTGPGIFHEISGAATIRGNIVERNGSDLTSWLWGSGILIAASTDVEVFDNTVTDNANAIGGVQQDRGAGTYGERLLANLHVYNNTITPGTGRTGIVEDVGDDAVFTSRNNRFSGNTYIGVRGRAYEWLGRARTIDGWIGFDQDVDGVWLDEAP